MKILSIQGKEVLVDDDVFSWAKHFKWRIGTKGHIYIHQSNGYVWLHRVVMDTPEDMLCDHVNRNTLDNRKENLRNCTHAENSTNRSINLGKVKYRGVSIDKRRKTNPYRAFIQANGKRTSLGVFASPEEAALAYDSAAKELHGEFAMLNF